MLAWYKRIFRYWLFFLQCFLIGDYNAMSLVNRWHVFSKLKLEIRVHFSISVYDVVFWGVFLFFFNIISSAHFWWSGIKWWWECDDFSGFVRLLSHTKELYVYWVARFLIFTFIGFIVQIVEENFKVYPRDLVRYFVLSLEQQLES